MENMRKGICINIGNCNQADKEVIQEVPISADFTCSECGRDLIPIEKPKQKLSKPLLIAIPIIILLLIGGGYAWYYFSKAKAVVNATKSVMHKTSETLEKALGRTDVDSVVIENPGENNRLPENTKSNTGETVKSVPDENKSSVNLPKNSVSAKSITTTETSEKIRKALLNISNSNLSFDQRISRVDQAMSNIFSKDLVVETFINSKGIASHLWDKGHGKDYLEHLAMEQSIVGFKILAHIGSIPDISYLQVIEVYKQ